MSEFDNISIGFDRVQFRSVDLSRQISIRELHGKFGKPERVHDPLPPAPYGFRNNQIHMYESSGVYFIEDHASRLITSIEVVFEIDDCPFGISNSYSGDLQVFGGAIKPCMTEKDLSVILKPQFRNRLPGTWSARKGGVYISIDTIRKIIATRRRSRLHVVSGVSVCFSEEEFGGSP